LLVSHLFEQFFQNGKGCLSADSAFCLECNGRKRLEIGLFGNDKPHFVVFLHQTLKELAYTHAPVVRFLTHLLDNLPDCLDFGLAD
jgi:hypothetical protein